MKSKSQTSQVFRPICCRHSTAVPSLNPSVERARSPAARCELTKPCVETRFHNTRHFDRKTFIFSFSVKAQSALLFLRAAQASRSARSERAPSHPRPTGDEPLQEWSNRACHAADRSRRARFVKAVRIRKVRTNQQDLLTSSQSEAAQSASR